MEKEASKSGLKNRWAVTAAVCLGAFVFVAMQYACSSYLSLMIETSGMDGAQQGLFTGVQSLAQIAMVFIGSFVSLRLGIKRSVLLGTLVGCIAGASFFVGSFGALVLGRVLLAVTNGLTVPPRATILSFAFGMDKKSATLATGVVGSFNFVGRFAVMAGAYPLMAAVGSWQLACLVIGSTFLVAAIVWFVTYPAADEYQGRGEGASHSVSDTLKEWSGALRNETVRKMTIYFACSGFGGIAFGAFAVKVMSAHYGIDSSVASTAFGFTGLAGLAGAIVGGVLARKIRIKNLCGISVAICGVMQMTISYFLPTFNMALVTGLCCVFGFFQAVQSTNNISIFYKMGDMSPEQITIGYSCMLFFLNLSGYLSCQIFGLVYPTVGIDATMALWAIVVLVGAAVAFTIREPKLSDAR